MNSLSLDREKAARLTFGFALIILVHRYLDHALVHQMLQPPLFITGFDYTYWIYRLVRFPAIFVENHTGAVVFDLILIISTVWSTVTAANNRIITGICALGWTLYGITYNSYVCHFTLAITGAMFLPYVFLAKSAGNFSLAWEGARYYCLYFYTDAFIHKAVIGRNFYYFPMGSEIIKTNQAQYLIQNPHGVLATIYSFFISHPGLSYVGFVGMVILQGSMVIGFFTKRYDRYLFFVPIVFHLVNYLFVDVLFFELLILNITLLPFRNFPGNSPAEHAIQRNAIL